MRLALFLFSLTLLLAMLPAQSVQPPGTAWGQRPAAGPETDLNGIWGGHLLQNPGGIAPSFEFSMQLSQNGIFLKGTSFVRHGKIWAEMELSGFQLANGTWKVTETKILRGEKPEDLSWCLKRYELVVSYTPEGLVLHGPWWGNSGFGPCVPGSIRLLLLKKSA